jgi:hypothetical protein
LRKLALLERVGNLSPTLSGGAVQCGRPISDGSALVAIGGRNVMLTLMKKGPWDKPKIISEEESRRYWALQLRRYRRRRLLRQLGLSALVAVGSFAGVWAVLSYGPSLPSLSFGSSPSVTQVRSFSSFRNCAAARAAGAAPLRRGQPGYASHLDADDDGIACEWSWRNWLR